MQYINKKSQSSAVKMKFWRNNSSKLLHRAIKNGWNLIRSDCTEAADTGLMFGFLELHPAIKARENILIILGLPIRPSELSKIKFPNIVSERVIKVCSLFRSIILIIYIANITQRRKKKYKFWYECHGSVYSNIKNGSCTSHSSPSIGFSLITGSFCLKVKFS
jgi:hypothetical protein